MYQQLLSIYIYIVYIHSFESFVSAWQSTPKKFAKQPIAWVTTMYQATFADTQCVPHCHY